MKDIIQQIMNQENLDEIYGYAQNALFKDGPVSGVGGADKILDYADRPSFCLYSSGLSPPREILIRFSRYQTI